MKCPKCNKDSKVMYAYCLYWYTEDGIRDCRMTLDRNKVVSLCESYNKYGWFTRVKSNPIDRIKRLLRFKDEELVTKVDGGQHGLMDGWGGLVFHVLKIDG